MIMRDRLRRAGRTYRNELLDLRSDLRIPHVLIESFGVALSLLQDALHNGVLQDGQDLE
jgi:hypothetical protein